MNIDIYNYPTAKETADPLYMPNYQIAVIEAFNNGAEVEATSNPCFGWCRVTRPIWDWKNGIYRVIKPKIAKGHNPSNLTEYQVGINEGWRLLTIEEINFRNLSNANLVFNLKKTTDVQKYEQDCNFFSDTPVYGDGPSQTYRTKKPDGYFLKVESPPDFNDFKSIPEGIIEFVYNGHTYKKLPAFNWTKVQ
jgi:hypothetical protein